MNRKETIALDYLTGLYCNKVRNGRVVQLDLRMLERSVRIVKQCDTVVPDIAMVMDTLDWAEALLITA